MKYKYDEDIYLDEKYCDKNNKLKMSELFMIMQDGARKSSEIGKQSREVLLKRNRAFILTRVSLKVKKMPKNYSDLHLCTWAKNIKRLFFLRDYIITVDNEEAVLASSVWVILDLETRTPISQDDCFETFKNTGEIENAINGMANRIRSNKEAKLVSEVKATYSIIDPNQHVNNTKYLDLIYDVLDEEYYEDIPFDLDINYSKEIKYNEIIKIYTIVNEASTFIEGRVDDISCFTCLITKT